MAENDDRARTGLSAALGVLAVPVTILVATDDLQEAVIACVLTLVLLVVIGMCAFRAHLLQRVLGPLALLVGVITFVYAASEVWTRWSPGSVTTESSSEQPSDPGGDGESGKDTKSTDTTATESEGMASTTTLRSTTTVTTAATADATPTICEIKLDQAGALEALAERPCGFVDFRSVDGMDGGAQISAWDLPVGVRLELHAMGNPRIPEKHRDDTIPVVGSSKTCFFQAADVADRSAEDNPHGWSDVWKTLWIDRSLVAPGTEFRLWDNCVETAPLPDGVPANGAHWVVTVN